MSGVFGLWNLDGRPVEPETLARMAGAMAHRGPDGSGVWQDGPVGLGHLADHTTPESSFARQPLATPDGKLIVTADVRLDNRDALIQALAPAAPPWEVSDAELVREAYTRWGANCVERLLGDFAFAVWDQSRRIVFCARDHFGVKPLYFFHRPGRLFAFASEVKALLTLAEVSDEIDELEVARLLVIPVVDDPGATFYRDARRVLPAHSLTVKGDGIEQRRYWDLEPQRTLRLASDSDYADAVEEAFTEAVRCRLRSSRRIASMLSGGIDSSSITCVAARLLEGSDGQLPLQTLSAVYDTASASDEREFIQEVLKQYDTAPHFFSADAIDPVGEIDAMNGCIDGANDGGNVYLNWNLYRSASALGAGVVLDGFDGDTTLSHGIGRLTELALGHRWWTLARELKAFTKSTNEPWIPVLRSWILGHGIKPLARRVRRRPEDNRRWQAHAAKRMRMLEDDYRGRLEPYLTDQPAKPRTEREEHHGRLTRPGLNKSLGIVEAVGAGAGVEVRFPFFDVRLVELCLSLPAEQKLRGGWSRRVMRNAMKGVLPEKVRLRHGKSNVSVGLYYALRSHGKDSVIRVERSADGALAEYIRPSFVNEMSPRFLAGTVSKSEEFYYWRVLAFALWVMGRSGAEMSAVAPPRVENRSRTIHRRFNEVRR